MRPLRGLRGRLVCAVGLVLVLAFAGTFLAVYRGTGSDLRHRVDQELGAEMDSLQRSAAPVGAASPAGLVRSAKEVLADQPFRAATRLLYVLVPGVATVTNETELLGLRREPGEVVETATTRAREAAAAGALLRARTGYSVVTVPDVGRIRLLVRHLSRAGVELQLGAGESLELVTHAQHDVAAAFALGGSIALAVALLAVSLVASGVLAPLRRITASAALFDAGELTPRLAPETSDPHEVRVLALALDHMLGRLSAALERQREFAAEASHELRTPLTAIRGQLEVLSLDASPDAGEVRRVERLVRAEVQRMERLVEDLLLLARTDEGPPPEPRIVDLRALAREVLDSHRTTATRAYELAGTDAAAVRGDPDRLRRAVENLVVNAVQHTRDGGLVRIVVARRDGSVSVALEDDGPGVGAEQREAIFERFHRTDAARARRTGGSGLGLAIVRSIAEAHGGRVFAGRSAEGGARIGFEIPTRGASPG